jgi:hypothetical protein
VRPKPVIIAFSRAILSLPDKKSVMVSLFDVAFRAVLNIKVSNPSPPVKVSFPAPPIQVSLPEPPLSTLAPLFPVMVLARALPVPLIATVPVRVRFSTPAAFTVSRL